MIVQSRTRALWTGLAASIASSWLAASGRAQDVAPLDFSESKHFLGVLGSYGTTERVEEDDNAFLRWHVSKQRRSMSLALRQIPKDLRAYEALAFRFRSGTAMPSGTFRIRIHDRASGYISLDLPAATTDWRSVRIPLGYFEETKPFSPTRVRCVKFVAWDTGPFTLDLDDVTWHRGKDGEASWLGGRGPTVDLSQPDAILGVTVGHSRIERVDDGVAWRVAGGEPWSALNVCSLSRDVRSFESVEVDLRCDRRIGADELRVRFYSTPDDYMGIAFPAVEKPGKWIRMRLRLPEFAPSPRFDPSNASVFEIVGWEVAALGLEMRRVTLHSGKRGPDSWRPSDKELRKRIFGKRYRKAKHIKTRFFDIHTDSRAARGKFAKALDGHVDVVRKHLHLPAVDGRIPVYVFRNAQGYYRYCERALGMTPEQARMTAGLGSGEAFIVYYTEPNASVVVHELTHTLVHRTLGPYGGSWLQEGLAVYVECAFERKNAATEFATDLRNERHTPLEKFIRTTTLAFTDSIRESGVAGRNYRQAGAFLAFLKDGPWKHRYVGVVKALTSERRTPDEQIALLEKRYGVPLAKIEAAWREWGSSRR